MDRPTKVLNVTLMLVCHNGQDPLSAIESLEHNHPYLHPHVVKYDEKEVDWTDEHPLNGNRTWKGAFNELFFGRPIDHIRATAHDIAKVFGIELTPLRLDLLQVPLMLLWKKARGE